MRRDESDNASPLVGFGFSVPVRVVMAMVYSWVSEPPRGADRPGHESCTEKTEPAVLAAAGVGTSRNAVRRAATSSGARSDVTGMSCRAPYRTWFAVGTGLR